MVSVLRPGYGIENLGIMMRFQARETDLVYIKVFQAGCGAHSAFY
jgi:hypothetical protein